MRMILAEPIMDAESYTLVRNSFGLDHIYIFCFLILAISLSVFLLCMQRNVNVYDKGLILFGAQRILDGDFVHRDFYADYGPGQFYTLALLFKVFSPSVLVERVWDSGMWSAIVSLVFWFVSQNAFQRLAWTVALASMVWLTAFSFYVSPMFPVIAATLAGSCVTEAIMSVNSKGRA